MVEGPSDGEDRQRWSGGPSGPVEPWPPQIRRGVSADRSTKWWPLLLVGLIAVVIVAVVLHPHAPLVAQIPTPAPTPRQSTASMNSKTTPASRPSRPPLVTVPAPLTPRTLDLGHPILGVTAGWELFARGDASLTRIELAKGRVISTPGLGVASSGPVSFLAGPDLAIVRPLDFVAGLAVRDGHNAADLTGALSRGGPVVVGPDAAHIWVDTGANGGPDVMTLTDWSGIPTRSSFSVPTDWFAMSAQSDGAGGVLFMAQNGSTYQAQPGQRKLLTTGNLLAVGPTGYLVRECATAKKCQTSVVDRTTGKRRTLAKSIVPFGGVAGLISPDGQTAAVIDIAKVGSTAGRLSLVDLSSGVEHPLATDLGTPTGSSSMVWSPDGRWLFVVTAAGHVAVIDPDTRHVRGLGLQLPFIEQLAIRAAPKPGAP